MRLRSSRGYYANDSASHRVGDKKHTAIDETDRIETQLIGRAEIVELDHVRVQEDLCGGSESRRHASSD
jgi:predicted ATP-grasp superfamily ATP-dependent carboligase